MPKPVKRLDGSIGATLTPADERSKAAKTQLNAADFDAAKKAIEAAKSVEDIVKTLPMLVELVARLAEAMGMTPVSPAAEVSP